MATSYNKTTWATGDFITADRMNNIENALEAVSNEISSASGQNAAENDTLASRLNDMIMIQNTQPDSANNEIWINSSTAAPNNPIEIPTEEEFEALRNSIAEQYSESSIYEVGKYVLHDNNLYKCTTAVETAGTWANNANKFTSVILANEVKSLTDGLDNKVEELKSAIDNITNKNNLFLDATLVPNKIYSTSPSDDNTKSYFIVPVINGTTYRFACRRRFTSKEGVQISGESNKNTTYMADFTGNLYVTIWNDTSEYYGKWAMVEDGVALDTVGSYQQMTLSENILAQVSGSSKEMTMSQKAILDADNGVKTYAENTVNTIRNNNNLFNDAEYVENAYYYESEQSSASYSYFKVPVTNGKTYRFACVQRFLSKDGVSISGERSANLPYTADFTGILYVTVYNTKQADEKWAMVSGATDPYTVGDYQQYTLTDYIIAQEYGVDKSKVVSQYLLDKAIKEKGFSLSKGYATDSSDMSTGDDLTLPVTNCKKNNVYSFCANITSFGSIQIGHGTTEYNSAYITIDSTNVVVTNKFTDVSEQTYPHGLTINDYIKVLIIVGGDGTATIRILSGGSEFTKDNLQWYGDSYGSYYAKCITGTLTDCVFTWGSADFRKRLWAFGDSYFSFLDPARWTYYLKENGYLNNVYLNAYPGENTTNAKIAFNNAVSNYGTPKMIIWAVGMNDGSDSGEYPQGNWKDGINNLIAYCTENRVEPILCTIPTVPTVDNEAKNAFVRNSGYRYIDFAKAVGATSSGVWYSGMLAGDGVHPTALGAKALFYRAITDCPELTFDNI